MTGIVFYYFWMVLIYRIFKKGKKLYLGFKTLAAVHKRALRGNCPSVKFTEVSLRIRVNKHVKLAAGGSFGVRPTCHEFDMFG